VASISPDQLKHDVLKFACEIALSQGTRSITAAALREHVGLSDSAFKNYCTRYWSAEAGIPPGFPDWSTPGRLAADLSARLQELDEVRELRAKVARQRQRFHASERRRSHTNS
jgi:hypothetical protein